MIKAADALRDVPDGLRKPLLKEYESIVQNYMERRWSPSELSGGLFCEIVYTILDGHAKNKYAAGPAKPGNFVDACKKLESNAGVPRSFQILIPRTLPALYEVRNNRGVGHAGGDVDPNHMDAIAVLSMSNWIMAELIRVFHSTTTDEAQALVDNLVERRVPLVWQSGDVKRVLDPKMPLPHQALVLLASTSGHVKVADLVKWTDTKTTKEGYFLRMLRQLHSKRQIEPSSNDTMAEILPPGSQAVDAVMAVVAAKKLKPQKGKKR
jgi:hypothetical protein